MEDITDAGYIQTGEKSLGRFQGTKIRRAS